MMDSELDEHRLTPCRKRVTKSNAYDVPINRDEEPIEVSRKTVNKTWFFNDIIGNMMDLQLQITVRIMLAPVDRKPRI